MDPRKGIVLKICAALNLVLMGACISGLKGEMPIGEVVFFRSVIAMLPLCLWMVIQGGFVQQISTRHLGGHFIRSFSGSGGMIFSYMALAYLPLADATAISYATPLFTVVLAAVLLKEIVRIYRWAAVVAGLCGVLVILLPHLSWGSGDPITGAMTGGLFGLAAAGFSAVSMIQIRHLAQTENAGAIVFYFTMFTMLIGLASIAFGWEMPSLWQWALLVGAGIFGGAAQIFVTLSLRHAEASLLAPFDYTTMIWALLVGYIFMGQVPALTTICGAFVVIASGLFTLWRERQLRRKHATQQLAAEQLTLATN